MERDEERRQAVKRDEKRSLPARPRSSRPNFVNEARAVQPLRRAHHGELACHALHRELASIIEPTPEPDSTAMTLQAKIEADLKTAMRDHDDVARDTLRLVLSEIKRKQNELLKDELSPEEEQAVLLRAVKTRQESIEQFDKAGRSDLSTKERAELAVIQTYLPKMMSEDEARAAVKSLIAELKITSKKDMGALMKPLMAKYKGLIDGKTAQKLIAELLP